MDDQVEEQQQQQQQQQPWDASQYEAALSHFEKLQDQIDALRCTIPSLVAPLHKPTTSKAQLFSDVRKAALQSTENVKAFRASWTSEETQRLLERSKESFDRDEDLSKALGVPKYGWSDREGQ